MKILLKVLVVGMIGAILVCLTPVQSQNTSITPITTVGSGSGSAPSGAAGGALSGIYPNPQVASGVNITNANLVTPTIGVAKGTSVALTNGLTAATVTGTNSGTFGSATINTNLTVGGQAGFTGVTVANLPTGVAAGYQTYCTDVLSPNGVGDRVEWDGSVWRTMRTRITATTDPMTYFLACLGQGVNVTTPITTCYYAADNYGPIGILPRISNALNGGASLAFNSAGTYGTISTIQTGTNSNGGAYARGPYIATPASGSFYFTSGILSLNALPDGTDNYWVFQGFDNVATATLPVTCVGWLYDKYNALGRGSPGVETNHWLGVTGRASSFTVVDSGLTPSTNASAPDRLAMMFTTTNAVFATNGVICATLSTAATIPNLSVYGAKIMIVKTLGSTAKSMFEARPSVHIRYASAPTFP